MRISPLRYPGGKSKLAPLFEKIYEYNPHLPKTFSEPFCGGASVGLELLVKGKIEDLYISDSDPGIYAFWWTVTRYPEDLCELIEKTPVDFPTWLKMREIFETEQDKVKLGFATFYLNRTNISGILNAGCIGGKEQKGNFKIDARFNKPDLIKRIERIADYRGQISIGNNDAMEAIMLDIASDHFIFIDPPYFKKGSSLYRHFYKPLDHMALADFLRSRAGCNWLVTYDMCSFIYTIYHWARKHKHLMAYSLYKDIRVGAEYLIQSNSFEMPEFEVMEVEE